MRAVDVVHLPDGERWWADGEIALDARGDLWSGSWWLPGPWDSGSVLDGKLDVRGATRHLRGTAAALRPVAPDPRGRKFDGWNAPEGPTRTPWCWRAAETVWWWDQGTLYHRTNGRTWAALALPSPPDLVLGPDGSALIDGRFTVSPDGRVRRLATDVTADRWVRIGPEGCYALRDDQPVRIDRDGAVTPVDAIPWGPGRRWRPSAEDPGPPALHGHHLAGPGGAIWNLESGERTGSVPPGLIAETDEGFAVVRRAGGEVRWLDLAGALLATGHLDIGPDMVTRLAPGPVAVTADGGAWRLSPQGAVAVEKPRPMRRTLASEQIPVEGVAEVGGVRWGWRADGLLVRL